MSNLFTLEGLNTQMVVLVTILCFIILVLTIRLVIISLRHDRQQHDDTRNSEAYRSWHNHNKRV